MRVQFSSSHSKTLSRHEIDWKTFWGVSWLDGSKHIWTQIYVWIGLYSRKDSKKEQAIYAARISANIQWCLTLLRHFQSFFFLSPFSYFYPFRPFLNSFFLTKFYASLFTVIIYLPSTIPVFYSSIFFLTALSKIFLSHPYSSDIICIEVMSGTATEKEGTVTITLLGVWP
jgi:hypothetical protein